MGDVAMARLIVLALAVLVSAVSATSSGNGVCLSDGSNRGTCCKPDGTRFCVEIKASDISNVGSNGGTNITVDGCNLDGNGNCPVCMWANLAGQTPDSNVAYNTPYINSFACGGDQGDCNFASSSAIADTSVATQKYYAMVDNTTSISAGATQASTYWVAFNKALSRYNCEEQYSHWNCDDCRKAYARWACAMTMPACDAGGAVNSGVCNEMKPCVRICNEVVQKCPVTLGFTCPDDNRDYAESGCNFMGLKSGASNVPVSLLSAAAMAGIALALARQN